MVMWLVEASKPVQAECRLFCFPYAGGNGHIFENWGARIETPCEVLGVEYPGRGRRFAEQPIACIHQLVEALYQAIKSRLNLPFYFFGHSNGALVAYELAKLIEKNLGLNPACIFISAKVAPHCEREEKLHQLGDKEFIQVLADYQGTPESLLKNRELLEVYLPLLRADFALSENYHFNPGQTLKSKAVILAGTDDNIAMADKVFRWEELFVDCKNKYLIDGNHFFIHKNTDLLLKILSHHITGNNAEFRHHYNQINSRSYNERYFTG